MEQTNKLKLISVEEVVSILNAETTIAAKKWLLKNNIVFQKFGKQYYALEAEVKCEVLIGYAKSIQKKYPKTWVELLKKIANDELVYDMLMNKLSKETFIQQPTTKLTLKNKKEKELLKELLN